MSPCFRVDDIERRKVNVPLARLIATSRWLIVAGQQVNRNHRLLVNVAGSRLEV